MIPWKERFSRDVKVETTNTSVLTDENKLYQVLDDTDTVTVTVRASRSVLENLNSSDISATADFSELSFTNTVPIRLSVSRYVDKQIESISGSIDSMKLEVEDKKEKQLVIEIAQTGEPGGRLCRRKNNYHGWERHEDYRSGICGGRS